MKSDKIRISPVEALHLLTKEIVELTKGEKTINLVETCSRCASVSTQVLTHSICDIGNILLFDTTEDVEEYEESLNDSFSHFEEKYKERVRMYLGPEKGDIRECFGYINPETPTVFVVDPYSLQTVKKFFVELKNYKKLFPEFKFWLIVNNAWNRHPKSVPTHVENIYGEEKAELVFLQEYHARSMRASVPQRGNPSRSWSLWQKGSEE